MRKLNGFLLVIASIALILTVFLFCVESVVLNQSYFNNVFMVEGRARELKVNHSDLMRVNDDLLEYIKGKDVDLSQTRIKVNGNDQRAFDSTEVHHMVDVKELYSTAKSIRLIAIAAIVIIVIIALSTLKIDKIELLAKSYQTAFILIIAIVAGLGIWMAVDFDSFWDSFHYLVFSDLSWQLDPAKNFMIRMYPLDFWLNVCKSIAIRFGIITGLIFLASFIYEKFRKYKRSRILALDMNDDRGYSTSFEPVQKTKRHNTSYTKQNEETYFDEYDPVD